MGLRVTLLIVYYFTLVPNGSSQGTLSSAPPGILTTFTPTGASAMFSSTTIPSDLPKIIAPPAGVPEAPPNTTLFNIGFTYGLNYQFVLEHPKSQQQIFKFLPMGLAYGMDSPLENFTMQTLAAYDTMEQLGYLSTVARVWVPSALVATLNVGLEKPSSQLYRNPDSSVQTIFSLVSPSLSSELLISSFKPSGSVTTLATMTSATALPPKSTNSTPGSGKLSAKVKSIIGFLVPVSVLAFLAFVVTFKYQKLRKNRALSSHQANITDDNSLPPFLQPKPELDGEDQIHEVSAQERWMELHGEGRRELQGTEIPVELHGKYRQRVQELASEPPWHELPVEGCDSIHRTAAPRDGL